MFNLQVRHNSLNKFAPKNKNQNKQQQQKNQNHKIYKAKPIEMKEETDKCTLIFGEFNVSVNNW